MENRLDKEMHQEAGIAGKNISLYDYHKKMAEYHYKHYQSMAGRRLKARSPKSNTIAALTGKRILHWPLNLSYFEISGLKDPEIERCINELILKKTYDLVEAQKKRSKNLVQIIGNYDVKLNRGGLLSIYFQNYSIGKGEARGLILADSLTVDMDTGKIYGLKDLFQEESPYIQRLNTYIKQQIKIKKIQLITDFHTIHRDQQFYLIPQAIGIYFQTYAYTPYDYGIPQFMIPYNSLTDFILVEGPLPRLL